MRQPAPAPGTLEPALVVRGLRKSFGAVEALTGVDLTVSAGEVVALLGRNGAGKTTLMRVLGTTVLADEGSASIDGADVVTDAARARRSCGLVLGDERSWYWRLTGRANLEFFATLHGLRRGPARRRVQELLDQVSLDDVADTRFADYSAGMRARLSLARALLVEPAVLLLDEPSKTLDPVLADQCRALVVELARERGRAALWVTHDLHEAAAVADRVLVLHGGRVVRDRSAPCSADDLSALVRDVAA